MPVCPLDYRYGREEVKSIFSEESKLKFMLQVELALLKAHAKFGNIPDDCVEVVESKIPEVKLNRVKKIESEIKHDVMAMVKALAELCGECGKYIHLGATSNDIIDTATALQLKQFMEILEKDLVELEDSLASLAREHRHTIMLGRTHGQAAVPITFGLKMAVFLAEVLRHHERLRELKKRILVGKMMGAVGTGAALGKNALEIQAQVMNYLGLNEEESPTQIVARDRYVEFVSFLAGIATSLEKFATEIRNLQRSEIGEVQESFDVEKQVGSSTMAHKRNPITAENICGLARIVRGFLIPTHESAILWHERDLTNSSAERFIIPHVCTLVDDILVKSSRLFRNLQVNKEVMLKNLRVHEEVMAEAVIMHLVSKGWGRQEAHEAVRRVAMKGGRFRDALMKDEKIGPYVRDENQEILDPLKYVGVADRIIDRILTRMDELRK